MVLDFECSLGGGVVLGRRGYSSESCSQLTGKLASTVPGRGETGGEQKLPSIQKGKWARSLGDRGGREGPSLPVEEGGVLGVCRGHLIHPSASGL